MTIAMCSSTGGAAGVRSEAAEGGHAGVDHPREIHDFVLYRSWREMYSAAVNFFQAKL